MSGSSIGKIFRLTTFGESHGPAIGGIVEGCLPGTPLCAERIQTALDRRRPGQNRHVTARKESDRVELLSGVLDGLATGAPIGFYIANTNQRSADYNNLKDLYRPGHADYAYQMKYGLRDWRGGGRASARETACRVVAGAIAEAMLEPLGLTVRACTRSYGGIAARCLDIDSAEDQPFCSPDPDIIASWTKRAEEAAKLGDSIGGLVQIEGRNVPAGLGEPVFDKLDARLAYALMGVGAVKAVEIGDGFAAADALGSVNNDPMLPAGSDGAPPTFGSNHAGGVLGGISSGQSIIVRVAVKPIPSIATGQKTVDVNGRPVELHIQGRHDVCAIPRIVPVLKSMVLITLADFWLLQRSLGR